MKNRGHFRRLTQIQGTPQVIRGWRHWQVTTLSTGWLAIRASCPYCGQSCDVTRCTGLEPAIAWRCTVAHSRSSSWVST